MWRWRVPFPVFCPSVLACALQRCPPAGCPPCKVAVGSLVSPTRLRHQLCPTSLVPMPYPGWRLEWGVSHNAPGLVPQLKGELGFATSERECPGSAPPPCAPHLSHSSKHTQWRGGPTW